ncbi:hypothetical protein ACFQ51_39375 [Streptomyces kaempferi]
MRSYTHGGSGAVVAVRSSLPGGAAYLGYSTGINEAVQLEQVARQQYTPFGRQRASANSTALARLHPLLSRQTPGHQLRPHRPPDPGARGRRDQQLP